MACVLVTVLAFFVVGAVIALLLIEGVKLYYDWQAGCAHKLNEKQKALWRAEGALRREDR